MKKDRKWFIDKWTKERNKSDVHDPMYHFVNEFIADVKLLDDTEVLSEEWLDENKSSWRNLKIDDYYISVEKLQNLIIPKQEPSETSAPLIVSEDLGVLLEDMDIGKSSRYFTMIDALFHYWDTTVGSSIGDFISENKKELIEIILGNRGYEVEEVQRYKVEDSKYTLLCKWEGSKGWEVTSLLEIIDDDLPRNRLVFELTEREIKEYDPRYWAFRKPVDKTDN